MQPSQSLHRQTHITNLNESIRLAAYENSIPPHKAATRVVIDWLGYDLDDVNFIDSRDRGVDAWVDTEVGLEIFQIKTHNLDTNGMLVLTRFDSSGVDDLRAARDLLLYENINAVNVKALQQLLVRFGATVRNLRIQQVGEHSPLAGEDTFLINLHLVVLGEGLTPQAQVEFHNLQDSISDPFVEDGVPIQFNAILHTVDEIVDSKWREENRDWLDINNKKREVLDLTPINTEFISDRQNAIFYCKAIDLVNAYDLLGYQLFEPNVRANIKHSRVNKAIRNSVAYKRSRREFRFLNNGVTIICPNFSKPRTNREEFRITKPGIVNGLQTVIALHTAYYELGDEDKADFEKNCSVLVRILLENAVEDVSAVVKATNNQNPMKPRNLVSNSAEQLYLARLFAGELGWFYEAKQGAWDAFSSNPRTWRPDLGKRTRDFKPPNSKKPRTIDNERLAQTWLGFIGFASEAVNRKKELFNDTFYKVIFQQQTPKHGLAYQSVAKASLDAKDESPHPNLLLVSYLSREFAQKITPSAQRNRMDSCNRLGIDTNKMSRAEVDVQLSKDNGFVRNQALNQMSMLFTEFVGYVLYSAFGQEIHQFGHRVLNNRSYKYLVEYYSFDEISKTIEQENFESDDVLVILWLAFVDRINDMLLGDWGQSYRTANIKIRYIFSDATQSRLYDSIDRTNDFMKKRTLMKVWAYGVPEGTGIYDYIRDLIINQI